MTEEQIKVETPAAVSEAPNSQSIIEEILSSQPKEKAEEAKEEVKETAAAVKVEDRISKKAAEESRALKAERIKAAELQAKLDATSMSSKQLEEFNKAKELFKTDPMAALEALGADPLQTYQHMTDKWLEKDVRMHKDPLEEKLKTIDPYIESLKKKEAEYKAIIDQNAVNSMVKNEVLPLVTDELECLLDYCNGNKEEVAHQIYNAANHYWTHTLKEDKTTNTKTLFMQTAAHLEKKLEESVTKNIERAAKLKKFKNRFLSKEAEIVEGDRKEVTLESVDVPKTKIPFYGYDNRDESRGALIAEIIAANKKSS